MTPVSCLGVTLQSTGLESPAGFGALTDSITSLCYSTAGLFIHLNVEGLSLHVLGLSTRVCLPPYISPSSPLRLSYLFVISHPVSHFFIISEPSFNHPLSFLWLVP